MEERAGDNASVLLAELHAVYEIYTSNCNCHREGLVSSLVDFSPYGIARCKRGLFSLTVTVYVLVTYRADKFA